MAYPSGISLITVTARPVRPDGRGGACRVRVEAERKFGYPPDFVFERFTEWHHAVDGLITVQLPHSDQSGLTGDSGIPLDGQVAYRFELQFTRDSTVSTLAFVTLPQSLGPSVALKNLTDLGGWPHTTIISGPPVNTGDVTYTENPPGSGLYTVTVS